MRVVPCLPACTPCPLNAVHAARYACLLVAPGLLARWPCPCSARVPAPRSASAAPQCPRLPPRALPAQPAAPPPAAYHNHITALCVQSCHEGLRNDNGRQTLTASIETCIQPVPPRMTAEYASVSVMPKQHLQLPPSTVIQLLQAAWSNAGCFASELSGKENGKEERWVEGVCRR